MRILDDAICKTCSRVFCCIECRSKHELKYHAVVDQKPCFKISPKYNESSDNESVDKKNTLFDKASLICAICARQPLILKAELQTEILLHLELYHLPLRCRKCLKMYTTLSDLKEFSKCFYKSPLSLTSNQSCLTTEASEVLVTKGALPLCFVSQTSPNLSESHLTPISFINMRWKAKNKLQQERFISDSVSSIKNLSCISNVSGERVTEMTSAVIGKVVRCSSTPVQLEMIFAKPKEQTFNASGGHMSSIQYNSGCESDASPAFSQPNSQALEPVNRYKKVPGSRPRMTAITPLRQVMSKSIQKAFAEHRLPAPNAGRPVNTLQRKNMFDSTSSPEVGAEPSPALDLRLSPAIRRSQSASKEPIKNQINNQNESCELPYIRREILLSAQKLTTESIVITRTEHLSSISSTSSAGSSNLDINSMQSYPRSTNSSYQSAGCNTTGTSVFKSCSSVEIIATTTKEIQQYHSFDEENVENTTIPPLTPKSRIPGSIIQKKIIKFETPKVEFCDSQEFTSSPHDEFFTPSSTPMHSNTKTECSETETGKSLAKKSLMGKFSPLRRSAIKECAHSTAISRVENMTLNSFDDSNDVENDEVFLLEPEKNSQKINSGKSENKTQTRSGFWSLMTSVMRLRSFKGKNSKHVIENETSSSVDSNSTIRRSASVAGSLVQSKSLVDDNELSSLKRKRTYTTDNQSTSSYLAELNGLEATSDVNTSSKRFRIRGRRPIDRMLLNS